MFEIIYFEYSKKVLVKIKSHYSMIEIQQQFSFSQTFLDILKWSFFLFYIAHCVCTNKSDFKRLLFGDLSHSTSILGLKGLKGGGGAG